MAEHEVVEHILSEAKKEAEQIKEEARSAVEDRRFLLESQVKRIREQAEKEASEAEARIAEQTRRAKRTIERKEQLKLEQRISSAVSERIVKRFSELIGTERYAEILADWIAEGAMALRAEKAIVRSSAEEQDAVAAALPRAGALAEEISGAKVTLTADHETPLAEQGVVLLSPDGRSRYDSRVAERLRRNEAVIRAAVHQRFFASGDHDG